MKTCGFNPFTSEALGLCNFSTGAFPEKDAVTDISLPKKTDQAFVDFLMKRLSGGRTIKFFDILPKIKLKPFNTSTPSEEIPENLSFIIDAMSLAQKIKGKQKTFQEVAETLFHKSICKKGSSNRIDLVFDVYKQKPMKNAERRNRGDFDVVVVVL